MDTFDPLVSTLRANEFQLYLPPPKEDQQSPPNTGRNLDARMPQEVVIPFCPSVLGLASRPAMLFRPLDLLPFRKSLLLIRHPPRTLQHFLLPAIEATARSVQPQRIYSQVYIEDWAATKQQKT